MTQARPAPWPRSLASASRLAARSRSRRPLGIGLLICLVASWVGLALHSGLASAAPSDLDASFGAGGRVLNGFPGFMAPPPALQLDGGLALADGRVVLYGPYGYFNSFGLVVARSAANGSPDSSFGSGGQALLPGLGSPSIAVAAVDGSLYFAFNIGAIGVARVAPDGSLDSSWGSSYSRVGDTAGLALSATGDVLRAYSDNDNSIVGVDTLAGADGSLQSSISQDLSSLSVGCGGVGAVRVGDGAAFFGCYDLTTSEPMTVLLTATGSVRTSTADVGNAFAITVDSQGRALLAASDTAAHVARLTASGTRDNSFAITEIDGAGDCSFFARSVAVDGSDRPVLAGGRYSCGDQLLNSTEVVRLNSAGGFDGSFGTGGRQPFVSDNGVYSEIADVRAFWTSGTTIGVAQQSRELSWITSRFSTTGAPDPTWAGDGATSRMIKSGVDLPVQHAMLLTDSQNRVYASGSPLGGVVRYTDGGSIDTSYGTNGTASATVVLSALSPPITPTASIDPSDRVLVGGVTIGGADVIVRYTTAGALDTSFGGDGYVVLDEPGRVLRYLAIDSAGRVVILLESTTGTDVVVRRLLVDGSVDAAFGGGGATLPTSVGRRVVIDPLDRVVIAAGSGPVQLLRLAGNGTIDGSWASPTVGSLGQLVIDSSSRVLISSAGTPGNAEVRRFTASGVADSAFGTGGVVTYPSAWPAAMTIDGAGRALILFAATVPSYSRPGTQTIAEIHRLSTNGLDDPTFGSPYQMIEGRLLGLVLYTDLLPTFLAVDGQGRTLLTGDRFATPLSAPRSLTRLAGTDLPPDTVPPTASITSPTVGQTIYTQDSVQLSYSCADDAAGYGISSCIATVSPGDYTLSSGDFLDTTPGDYSVTVTATDRSGNVATATRTYTVLAAPAGGLNQTVSGGETITTDPDLLGASPTVPVQTEIVVPAGVSGQITVTPEAMGSPPAGFVFFGTALMMTGPVTPGAASPYVVTFSIDSSVLGGIAPGDVQVFRNSVAMPDCTDVSAALPDPCVAARGAVSGGAGDAFVTVRTTQFSVWTVGRRAFSVSGASPNAQARGVSHIAVVITGTGFVTGSTAVFPGGGVTVHSTTFIDAAHLSADISITNTAALGARDVRGTKPGPPVTNTICVGCFTVTAKPTITSLSPTARPQGSSNQTVTITGTGFASNAVVSFEGAGITINSVSGGGASLVVNVSVSVSAAVGPRNVTVTNPDGGVAIKANGFTVSAAPTLTSVLPGVVPQGKTLNVQVFGSGYPATFTTGGTVSLGPSITVNSVTRNSATRLTVNVTVGAAAALGVRDVSVTNPDGASVTCSGCFTVTALPTVGSLAPSSRGQGVSHQTVVVTGTGFQTGVTTSIVGGGVTVHSLTVTSATLLTLDISVNGGAAPGARNVVVTNPDTGTVTCVGCFTVTAKPTITNTAPNSRPAGATYTIAVNGTSFQNGAAVSFSGTGIQVDSVTGSGSTLNVNITIAPNAPIGNRAVTVTNPDDGTATKATGFKVLAAPAPPPTSTILPTTTRPPPSATG